MSHLRTPETHFAMKASLPRVLLALPLVIVLAAIALVGCSTTPDDPPHSDSPIPSTPAATGDIMTTEQADALADFSLNLFQAARTDSENLILSPLSVAYALGMVENGANDQTLAQMEDALGMPVADLNQVLGSLSACFTARAYFALDESRDSDESSAISHLSIANALWVKNGCDIKPEFLEATKVLYGARVFQGAFDDATVADINAWVNEQTNGMIPSTIAAIPPNAWLYLINTASFDAKWQHTYESDDVSEDTFTTSTGSKQTVEFMSSSEHHYVETSNATGFMKPYRNELFTFVGLLPDEGCTPSDVLDALTGSQLRSAIANARYANVRAKMPKFGGEYTTDLVEPLEALGITDVFDRNADLSGIWTPGMAAPDGGLAPGQYFCLTSADQTSFVEVDEQGTRAAAATVISGGDGAVDVPPETHTVCLDRPFVYMIVHTETSLPVFIGVVESVE